MTRLRAFAQLAAIRDEWLRPLVTRIEELAEENGRLAERAETVERERAQLAQRLTSDRALTDQIVVALEGERDILHAELEQLRRAFGLDANRAAFSPIEVATEPATVGEHHAADPDRGQVPPGGAGAVPTAPAAPRPRPASWIRRLLGRG